MSAATTRREYVRVWRVVPEAVHPDAAVDVSGIEPFTGFTQRAARELAATRNRKRTPCPTIRWMAEPTEQVVDRSAVHDRLR